MKQVNRRQLIGVGLASVAAGANSVTARGAEAAANCAAAAPDARAATGLTGVKAKMNPYFAAIRENLFTATERALQQGAVQMNWADPMRADPPNRDPLVSEAIIKATKEALDSGKTFYTFPVGLMELREAIAAKLRTYNGIVANPATEIVITPGSDMGLYFAMRVLLHDGDEVLNPDPSYPSNQKNVALMGGKSISVPLKEADGFDLNIAEFEKRVTRKTRAIVLTNPNNPTTKNYSRAVLEKLARFAVQHDLFVVADHAFEGAIFDGKEFVSIATLPGMRERTISVFSTSKGLGLSGYRVG